MTNLPEGNRWQDDGWAYGRQARGNHASNAGQGWYASQTTGSDQRSWNNGAVQDGSPRRPVYSAAPAQAKPSGKKGGFKTFALGFAGAMTACALAFGGVAAYNGFNGQTVADMASGTTAATTISVAGENATLAEAVAAKALPSVVAVYNYQQVASGYGYGYGTASKTSELQAAGMGSGVVISDDGYILTNYHVIDGASKLTVKVGDEEREATYVGGDESSDVAVLKVDDTTNLVAMEIGDSDSLATGEWVMTVGAPLGLEQSVATGIVSATNRSTTMASDSSSYYGASAADYTYYPNMIQTDAVINPGNSGGALVDSEGKLIGINTMISSYSGDYAGVGFAIPVNYAMGIAQNVIDGKEPTHAILGVSVASVTASNAQRYGLATTSGAYVNSVTDDSALQAGDIITAINGTAVTSATDITLAVREHNPGDTVTVTVNRNGQTLDLNVTLGSDGTMSA